MNPLEVDASSIRRLVHAFYGRVRQDQMLGPIFEARIGGRWPEHLDKMVGFWRAALLHERTYSGNPRSVHARLELATPEAFERWLALFADTLEELFSPATAGEIHRRASMMARGLLAARGFARVHLPMQGGPQQ